MAWSARSHVSPFFRLLDRLELLVVSVEPDGGRDQGADTDKCGLLSAILLLRIADRLAVAGAQLEAVSVAMVAPEGDLRLAGRLPPNVAAGSSSACGLAIAVGLSAALSAIIIGTAYS